MTRFSTLLTAFAFVGGGMVYGFAAGRPENPFTDHADTGEIIHVLPTPASVHSPRDTAPTDAPPANGISVYPASYGSGALVNHGGPEMTNAAFVAIFWNSSVSPAIQSQISGFVSSFGSGVPDFTVVQQYGTSGTPIAATMALRGAVVDTQSTQSRISDSGIRSYLTTFFQRHPEVTPDSHTLYGIYFPQGMRVQLSGGSSCTSFCGYHSHFTYTPPNGGSSIEIKYASFPYLDCASCSLSGKTVGDMLTIVTSHEIREAVTDPGDKNKNAWYDASGYEADDKCAWHNLYRMSLGGYWVQPEYSNADRGCVVP